MDEKHEFQINSRSLRARSWSRGQIASLTVVAALFLSAAVPVGANPRPKSAGHTTPRQMKPVKSQNLPPIEEAYGSRSAPITMEVFSDYSCPMCRNLFEQTLRPMINDYVASGKVYLIHRDYPLAIPGHQYSPQAARWARAAAKIGQFENVEGAFYDNQTSWSTDGNLEKYVSAAMSTADFKRVQKLMEGCEPPGPTGRPDGINMPPHPCSLDPYIEQDILLGNQVPVKGTPTYVITYKGQRLPPGSGFVSWPLLKQFFDSLLAQ